MILHSIILLLNILVIYLCFKRLLQTFVRIFYHTENLQKLLKFLRGSKLTIQRRLLCLAIEMVWQLVIETDLLLFVVYRIIVVMSCGVKLLHWELSNSFISGLFTKGINNLLKEGTLPNPEKYLTFMVCLSKQPHWKPLSQVDIRPCFTLSGLKKNAFDTTTYRMNKLFW